MRFSLSGAMVFRVGLSRRQLEPLHMGSRVLKHLRVLVEIRCAAPRPHELAYVYKLPGDVMPRVREHLRDEHLHGELLFVSTDSKRYEPGTMFRHDGDERIDEGDLGVMKAERAKVATFRGMRLLPLGVGREWVPLVDVLDCTPDDDDAHPSLECRCRCAARPPADRHDLVDLAHQALADGKTRRVFL